MNISNEIVINKSINAVWEVAGNQFSSAHIWASVLRHSEGSGEKINGQVCDSRTCDIRGMGRTNEKLTEFDPNQLIKIQMSAMLKVIAEDLKFYVENGRPHPRKK